jgi:poly(A) polymerase
MDPRRLEPCYAPISTDLPTERDRANDAALKAFMDANVPVMSTADLKRREAVLSQLTDIFKKWVRDTYLAKNHSEDVAAAAGGVIFTSGSYRLGIHEPGSDIDAHCCAPKDCKKADFFTTLKAILQDHPQVHTQAQSLLCTLC